jgi:hypothetical protein
MKRQLNKIIFIGSAFDYAEINLDGHTCIVGSNGVGKSTLLRAITFFYFPTNNRNDLGIPKSSKSFLEYYFDGLSYLIYEVKTETGFFHVIFYKKNNLDLCFRFVDSAYNKDFYMNEENKIFEIDEIIHNVKTENIYCSEELSGNKEYKNILYGNYQVSKKEKLRQFYLLKGIEKSHQIPVVIKDILLFSNANVTKLVGAKFVKEFIANIVSEKYDEEETGKKRDFVIDLKQLQKDLEQFTQKYQDIKDFYHKDNQRIKNIIKQQHAQFKELRQNQKNTIFILGGLVKHIAEQQVILLSEIAEISKNIDNLTLIFVAQKANFDTELETLGQNVAEAKIHFETAKKAKTAYQSADFQSKLQTVSQKENLQQELKAKQDEYAILSSVFSEIENKYKALFDALQNEKNSFQNQHDTKKLTIDSKFIEAKSKLNETQLIEKQQVAEKFAVDKKLINEEISTEKSGLATLKGQAELIRQKTYFAGEIAELNKEKTLLASQITEQKHKITLNSKEIEKLQTEYNNFLATIDNLIAQEKTKTVQKNEKLQAAIEAITQKLAIHSTSLYGYLSENMPEWKENIGKIFQENILFRTDLTPSKIENFAKEFTQSFYGLQIDLSKLEVLAKSLQEYEIEKADLSQKIIAQQNELTQFIEEKNREKHEKSVNLAKKKKEFETASLVCEQSLQNANNRLENIEVLLDETLQKAKQQKQADFDQNAQTQQAKKGEIEALELNLKNIDKLIEGEKQEIEQIFQTKLQKITAEKNQAQHELATETQAKQSYFLSQFQQLGADKTAELAGKNLDTQKIANLDTRIKQVSEKLQDIQKIENDINFQKILIAKNEFVDKIEELQNHFETLQKQQKDKKDAFSGIETQYKTENYTLNKAKTDKNYQKLSFENNLSYCENNFKTTEEYLENRIYFEAMPAKANSKTIIDLVSEISVNKTQIYNNEKEFGEAVRKFVNKFNENNSLGFVLENDSIQAYQKLANHLENFEMNLLIEDTKRETNYLRNNLVNLVYEKTETLLSKKHDVFKKVREINAEINDSGFVEAGLIDNFEMKPVDTDNLIIQKMQEISTYKNALFAFSNFENTNEKANENANDKIENRVGDTQKLIDLLNSLHQNIKDSKETELNLQDFFEITFSFKEGKNSVKDTLDLEAIGSNGTTTLIKTIIYIALLHSFAKIGGQKFNLHCILDEVGTISANNLKKLLEYAESRNIFLVNALPNSAKLHEMYKYTWNMYKNELGEQKINLLLTTKAKLK